MRSIRWPLPPCSCLSFPTPPLAASLSCPHPQSEEHSQQRSGQDEERKARIQKLTRGKGDSDKKQE
jgi:hypothetical protein